MAIQSMRSEPDLPSLSLFASKGLALDDMSVYDHPGASHDHHREARTGSGWFRRRMAAHPIAPTDTSKKIALNSAARMDELRSPHVKRPLGVRLESDAVPQATSRPSLRL